MIEKLRELPPEKQREVLSFVETLLETKDSGNGQAATASNSIWEEIDEITAGVSEEAWERVPVDGSEQHDHYLYGAPKK
ncbi:MAG: hypothetical protein JOZ52_08655 [Acidobacteria bacterium]|nr:hypothetical protein [Acidobacteriota bacterium]